MDLGESMKSKYIVIIDDADDNRLILKACLKQQGYSVEIAKDGNEALPLLTKFRPCLVISDIMMPNMGGFKFLETLKNSSQFNKIPVILMSAKSSEVVGPIAKELSAYAFLEKPVNLTQLKALVKSVSPLN